jgi:hypothetical protein
MKQSSAKSIIIAVVLLAGVLPLLVSLAAHVIIGDPICNTRAEANSRVWDPKRIDMTVLRTMPSILTLCAIAGVNCRKLLLRAG